MISEPFPRDPLAGDPFWGRLRTAHPDATVVVLPPVRASQGRPVPVDEARALAAAADAEVAAVTATAAEHGVRLVTVAPLWWAQADAGDHRYRRDARSERLGDGLGDGLGEGLGGVTSLEVMGAVVRGWLEAGWQVTALERPHPTVTAAREGLAATLSAYPRALTLEVVTDVVRLDADALEALERAAAAGGEAS